MDEKQYLADFEAGTLKPFQHRDHIHVAWLYLRRDGWDEGYRQIQEGIQHYAEVNGVGIHYHETITRFWAQLIHHAIQSLPTIKEFDTFIENYHHLLDKASIKAHYSIDYLMSDSARQTWHEPDLIPLPTSSS